jgi:SAM-dependent methyltransferase
MPDYYEHHADLFLSTTKDIDMDKQYQMFLPHLKPGARILDAGCGSGRDSLAFLSRGFRVDAFDLSPAMVDAAKALTGLPVRCLSFQQMDHEREFDGIWACASLLHVPRTELLSVFHLLSRALNDEGILYCSFKHRDTDFSQDGRSFTCFTVDSFLSFIAQLPAFTLLALEQSADVRKGREEELWLNAVLRKTPV